MSLHAKNSGSWAEASAVFVKSGGLWVPASQMFVRNAGVWEPVLATEMVVIAPTTSAAQSINALFEVAEAGSWSASTAKRLVVNSSIGPLSLGTAFGGSLTIEITADGIVSGNGGAANGGAGGHALTITAGTGITLINNGVIRGGGGGGGKGGTGGQGTYNVLVRDPASGGYYVFTPPGSAKQWVQYAVPSFSIVWAGTWKASNVAGSPSSYAAPDGYTYFKGALYTTDEGGVNYHYIARGQYVPNYSSGGVGGNGGHGQGADGASAAGSGGAAGGTNAGAGGTGGAGGTWGAAGSTGATGAAGNYGSGAAGASGGAAGLSVHGYNRVSPSGSGSLIGSTSSS